MRTTEQGFTLIELSILLLVVGLLIAGFLYGYNARLAQERLDKNYYATFSITDSLSKYYGRNGHYPCPAARDLAPDDDNYGRATDCADDTIDVGDCGEGNGDGYCVAEDPDGSGKRIRIGAVPFKDLGLGPEDVIDAYKNRFSYAASELQAVSRAVYNGFEDLDYNGVDDDAADHSVIAVTRDTNEGGLDNTPRVDVVFFSHGPNGAGSYTAQGSPNGVSCLSGSVETENCDNDGIFITEERGFDSDGIALFSFAAGPDYFDDLLIAGDELFDWTYIWDETNTDSDNIYNLATGNMGIGTDEPTEKLHVESGNLRVQNADIEVDDICDEAQENCFEPDILGGEGIICGESNQNLGIRIANRDMDCRSFVEDLDGECGQDSFVTSFIVGANGSISVNCVNHLNGATSSATLR